MLLEVHIFISKRLSKNELSDLRKQITDIRVYPYKKRMSPENTELIVSI